MAKRKKHYAKRKSEKSPQHKLPTGFWSQVWAVALIATSILLVVAWFNAGGPILEWVHSNALFIIGYAVYTIPLLFTYIAIEIFRAEDNKLSFAVKFATASAIIWFAALFGLLKNDAGNTTGGIIGDLINDGMKQLVNGTVAAFIYILLILITLLFITRVNPFTIIKKIWEMTRRDSSEQDENVKVMRNAAAVDGKNSLISNFKTNNATLAISDSTDEKQSRMSSLKNSITRDRAAEDQSALVTVSDPNWQPPSLDLLEKKNAPADPGNVEQNALIIQNTLAEFDIAVAMEGANIGPRVTQFTLKPPSGVKLEKITSLEKNIALNLAAQSLRMEAPIPGQKAVGIEVPNIKGADVRLHAIITSREWGTNGEPLAFAIGKDIAGEPIVGALNKMPHLLIAGQTGSGKSVMINTLLTSLLYHNSPSDMKLILVDPKQVEMAPYEDIPHLLTPVITEPDKTISALKWAVNEMQRRYTLLAEHKVKDIRSYNHKVRSSGSTVTVDDEFGIPHQHENGAMPYIVIVIDELADLMMVAARDVEALIVRLAQKARAVGIHLVLATQSPRVDVITGLIKANIPSRIAFTVSSRVESDIILGQTGAEKLLGAGDMLLLRADMAKPKRIQGAWVTDEEVHKIADHLRMQSPPQYNDDVVSLPVHLNGKGGVVMDFEGDDRDDAINNDAARLVIETGKASTTFLQTRLRIGYAKAARVMQTLEDRGIIGPPDGARPRQVLMTSMDDIDGGDENDDDL